MRLPTSVVCIALSVATVVLSTSGHADEPHPVFAAGPRDTLLASSKIAHTFVRPLRRRSNSDMVAGPTASSVPITVNYSGFTPEAQAAFQYAVDIWKADLSAPIPVIINAQFTPLGTNVLGSAGPTEIVKTFTGAPNPDAWYPIALANQLAGADLAPSSEDIDAQFSSTFGWYYGTDGLAPAGTYDFVTVVLHELGHGLGFVGSGDVSSGLGYWGYSSGLVTSPMVFDLYVSDDAGHTTTSFPSASTTLATFLQNGSLFFDAPQTVLAAGEAGARLYAPTSFIVGSSYSHLDESTYPSGNANSLMTPELASAEAIHDPGSIVRGMFADMGWQIAPSPPPTCTYSVAPGSGLSLGAAGGSGSFTVTTSAGCGWSIGGSVAWLTFTTPTTGTGSGTVSFTAAANGSTSARSGQLVIAGIAVLVSEVGATCSFTVTPANDSAGSHGGVRSLQVNASAVECRWTAVSTDLWIQPMATSGFGSATLLYSVQANASPQARTGGLVVGGIEIPVHQTGTRSAAVDFNGDGLGDAFVYNPTTGAWSIRLSEQGTFTTTSSGTWASGWKIQAADFNGDGLTDLFLYNPTNGLFFKATNIGNGQFEFFGYRWAVGWIPTIGDFNGDRLSDVFLYNPTSGQWFMCLTVPNANDFVYTSGWWAPGWQVYPADFDGDGRTDLFLYNSNAAPDPNRGRWFRVMTRSDASFQYVAGDLQWSNAWTITPADFDGDGKSELFLYNTSTGQWYLVQFTDTTEIYIGGAWAPGWTIRDGDFDGDGKADLFLYNPSNGQWFVAQTILPGAFSFYTGSAWATNWMISTTDVNADGRSDVLLYNAMTGTWFQVVTLSPGEFSYSTGTWNTGAILTSSLRNP